MYSENKEIELIPDWEIIQEIKYKISRKDFFTYKGSTRYPIQNSYEVIIRVRKIGNKRIRFQAIYLNGLLPLLTSFQSFSSFIGKEDLIEKGSIFTVNYAGDYFGNFKRITGIKKIKQYCNKLQSQIKLADFSKKEKKELKQDLQYLTDKKAMIKKFLSKDLELLHQDYGYIFSTSESKDYSKKSVKKKAKKQLAKALGKIDSKANSKINEKALLKTKAENNQFIINEINAINLISVDYEKQPKLDEIKRQFINDSFNIEDYQNISIHQAITIYNIKGKILNSYFHTRRTISETMSKITEEKITRI